MCLSIFLFLYISVYLSLSLSLSLSIYIYIYIYTPVSLLSVCLLFYLIKIPCFSPGHIVQTGKPPQMLLVVVALHHIKCAVIYWDGSNSMKRHVEQWYSDVSKYLSILSIYIYIYIYTSVCLSFSLSAKFFVLLSRPHCGDREGRNQMLLLVVALHHIKCAVIL
jgi:hypothetical protein